MRQLLHISDIHYGPHHLPDVAEGVLALIEERRPDAVVISGDLTHRAKPVQFQQARAFVDRIQVPTVTVPGNHDVPMYRFWERIGSPYGAYRKHFADDMEPEYEDDEIAVLGLNTAFNWTHKDGRVKRSRLRQLASRLAEIPQNKSKVIVAHHQLVPPPRYETQRVITNAVETVDVLADGGVDLVLSGHLHQTWIGNTEAYYPRGRHQVLLLHSGTTTTVRGRGIEKGKNTCNWIRLDGKRLDISHLMWFPERRRFLEQSRHIYPRYGAIYALDVLEDDLSKVSEDPAVSEAAVPAGP